MRALHTRMLVTTHMHCLPSRLCESCQSAWCLQKPEDGGVGLLKLELWMAVSCLLAAMRVVGSPASACSYQCSVPLLLVCSASCKCRVAAAAKAAALSFWKSVATAYGERRSKNKCMCVDGLNSWHTHTKAWSGILKVTPLIQGLWWNSVMFMHCKPK